MKDEVAETGFTIVFALIIFALALNSSIVTWQANRSFGKWVSHEISDKQLVVESQSNNFEPIILTAGEVIQEIKSISGIDIYINGSRVPINAIEDAKRNVELFTHAPFSFPNIASALYDKEYQYDAKGNICKVEYTSH